MIVKWNRYVAPAERGTVPENQGDQSPDHTWLTQLSFAHMFTCHAVCQGRGAYREHVKYFCLGACGLLLLMSGSAGCLRILGGSYAFFNKKKEEKNTEEKKKAVPVILPFR